jgi:putative transposase
MAEKTIPPLQWLRNQIQQLDTDLLRQMLKAVSEFLMGLEADQRCGAGFGQKSEARVNYRNGYRQRRWDTRVGTIGLELPRLRKGSYFPDWLLSPRRRAERALVQVVSESYVNGVSTRRVDRLATAMGLEGISKSQVSEMAKSLDELVNDFRHRPLNQAPYRYIWVDAITQRCREGGRVVNVIAVTATGVNTDGRRELLGLEVFTSEDQAAWERFFNALVVRGLKGVELIISDDHKGLKAALAKVFVGAGWQRCRTHFARNLLAKVPKAAQDFVAALNRSIFAQPNAEEVWAQHRRVVDQLAGRFEDAAQLLENAVEDILAFSSFPKAHWRQIWSNNPQERVNREIRRRTDVVGIFPNAPAVIRLVGALLCEQTDEWAIGRRYMSLTSLQLAKDRSQSFQPPTRREALPESLPLSA